MTSEVFLFGHEPGVGVSDAGVAIQTIEVPDLPEEENIMGFAHEFEGYIGTTWTVPKEFARVPGTRYVSSKSGLLQPTIYLNIDYELLPSVEDAILRIQLMREDPNDATGKFDIVLPKGRKATFDSRIPCSKKWVAGRPVHLQARVLGPVKTCVLYKTSYVAYSVIT